MLYANRVWGAPGHVTKTLQDKNGQKVDKFKPTYLGDYRYWWKMACDFCVHYQPSFFWLCSFTSTWKQFFLFHIFFLTFFLLPLSTLKPLNALYSKFKRLKISGRTSVRLKSGVPSWGDLPQSGPTKFWTFKPFKLDGSNFRNG